MGDESTSLMPMKKGTAIKDSNLYKRIFLVTVISLYSLGYEVSKPLASQYIYHRVSNKYSLLAANNQSNVSVYVECRDLNTNTSAKYYQEQQQAQEESSQWLLYLSIATGIPCVIACILLGSYSDSFGRKFMFALSSFGTCCRGVCYVVVVHWNLPLYYLFVGYLIEGCFGYYYGALLATYAYSSDITPPTSSRTRLVIIVQMGKYFSRAIAEISAGLLIKSTGYIYTGFILVGSMLLNILIIIVLLPETVETKTIQQRKSVCQHVKVIVNFIVKKDNPGNAPRGCYILGALAFSVYYLGVVGEDGVDKLYYMDSPLCWNALQIGYFEAAKRLSGPVGTLIVVWGLQRFFTDETIILLLGLSGVAREVTVAFGANTLIIYMSALVGIPESGYMSMIRAILSKETSSDVQGALFAGLSTLEGFTSIGGTVLFNIIYEATLPYMKGAVFLYAGFMTLVSLIIMWAVKVKYFHRVLYHEKIIN
ncbi:lysosomal proton-coupled steroid conjugate and bile acid symporter SLC46A3-like [Liolophura sinensis]|uniref:lysosomal proton-coupled steroid conjugate and bile acid symporter SLC46A3-like n=1 Tax=Liolophura sinensis TaxID=3198878 RepID=UPI00315927BD